MNNLENNILIAEFMGGKPSYENNKTIYLDQTRIEFIHLNDNLIDPRNLTYDSDWNALMKVVDKIENMYSDEDDDLEIQHNNAISITKNYANYHQFIIQNNTSNLEHCIVSVEPTKLKSVYKMVCDYIKYYNNCTFFQIID